MIKRAALQKLIQWSQTPLRAPLMLRGARQVGKSWLVREFGSQFDHYIEINFEKEPSLKSLFLGDIHIPSLLEKIALYTNKKIIPGQTLLFIDEIQECEAAIDYLRYFKEEYPELHVIGAGSLLDFKLESMGLPVGRLDFLFLTPLSFSEYLSACGHDTLQEALLKHSNEPVLHQKLLELLRTYCWLGGMPEVTQAWITYQDVAVCQRLQDRLLTAYKGDFEKYAKNNQIAYVEKIFSAIPAQLGRKFKYVSVDADARAAPLKQAMDLLNKAGIAHLCYQSSAQSPPLAASFDEKHFKAFFLDIGLAQRLLGTTHQDWIIHPLNVDNLGALAEQFVAQELIAYRSEYEKETLFYWHREAKNSNAEVDFVIANQSLLIPIEVKAGASGRLRSMHTYLESHPHSPYGLKISEAPFSQHGKIIEIPLYAIHTIASLLIDS